MWIMTQRGWRPFFSVDNQGNAMRLTDRGRVEIKHPPKDKSLLQLLGIGRRLTDAEIKEYISDHGAGRAGLSPTQWLRATGRKTGENEE
jgi:hypothetical protein